MLLILHEIYLSIYLSFRPIFFPLKKAIELMTLKNSTTQENKHDKYTARIIITYGRKRFNKIKRYSNGKNKNI